MLFRKHRILRLNHEPAVGSANRHLSTARHLQRTSTGELEIIFQLSNLCAPALYGGFEVQRRHSHLPDESNASGHRLHVLLPAAEHGADYSDFYGEHLTYSSTSLKVTVKVAMLPWDAEYEHRTTWKLLQKQLYQA